MPRAAILASALAAAASAWAQAPAIPEAFSRADKGHCDACHSLPAAIGPAGGDIGPVLTGARMRELGPGRLREILDDPMRANGNTAMPPYGRHHILDASEIDGIVGFLQALPDGDAAPVEAADRAADEAAVRAVLDRGRAQWTRKFADKRSLSGCFPNGGRRIAAVYPQYDPRVKRVITLEMAINQCLKVHHEALLDPLADDMGAIIAYVRSLADGQKIALRVPPAAQPRIDEGKRLYFTRMGQRNYACASCHLQSAGKRYGAATLTALAGEATAGPWMRNGKALTIQARMRECLERMGAAPFAAGSDELNRLEYYVTYRSNGMPLRTRAPR